MEKITFHQKENVFKYMFSGDTVGFHSSYDPCDFDENDMREITCPNVESIIKTKIENTLYDIVYLKCINRVFRYEIGDLIIASNVKKSQTQKSVEHEAIAYDKYDISSSEYFRYNLPDKFRSCEFMSVIARRYGPYTKERQDNTLNECEPWYKEEVCHTGTTYDCIKTCVIDLVDDFINNIIVLPLRTTFPFILDKVNSLRPEQMFDQIYDALSKSISIEVDTQESYKDYDDEGWREIAEDEERSMDEETDGFWRWNID